MSDDGKAEALKRLFQSIKTEDALRQKTNDELADLVRDHIWAHVPLISPQADLLGEVMDRLRAAPDLLAALKDVMQWIDGWDPNFIDDPEWADSREAARAAIAKAEGSK